MPYMTILEHAVYGEWVTFVDRDIVFSLDKKKPTTGHLDGISYQFTIIFVEGKS